MEFPQRVVTIERALVGVLLTTLVAAAAWESRSEFSWSVRRGTPFAFWLALDGRGGKAPHAFWSLYHPTRRTLDLVLAPGPAALEPGALPRAAGTLVLAAPGPAQAEPAAAAEWLSLELEAPTFWTRLLPRLLGGSGGDLPFHDRLLLALELRRLSAGGVRPAWLPEPASRQDYLARLQAPSEAPAEETGPIIVEVLNTSGRKGLASEATKVLRLRGADVVGYGNTETAAARTMVYDRTGRIEKASAVRDMLGCRAAGIVTQVNPKTLVDVSVLLAEDCAGKEEAHGTR